uniref:Uncharacterized protein n=1 Tax=Glossina morsitans morsitans TaxID=37546 RepID=A0A1B0GB13_GLOMM
MSTSRKNEQNRLYLSVSSIAVTGPMNCKVFDIRSSTDQVNHPFLMVSKPKQMFSHGRAKKVFNQQESREASYASYSSNT